jgi:N-acetyl sugar amidotransferase
MDTTDPDIVFDENGYCNHCNGAILKLNESEKDLHSILIKIREAGKNKRYDCVMGISGGVDSSYVLFLLYQLKLRPLVIHLDNGWNTPLAVSNMKKIANKLNFHIVTVKVDMSFKDLQLSFLKASTPDLEIPTDHAIVALLNKVARKNKIKYIISGANARTESIAVNAWSHGHHDWRYIKLIQKRFGSKKLKKYEHTTLFDIMYRELITKTKTVRILDYLPTYDKQRVTRFLEKEFEWKSYNTKHGESLYTFFIQSYILPVKFNYDKRKMHLSNLICDGQITREQACGELKKSLYTELELIEMKKNVCDEFGITEKEFDGFMKKPNKNYYDYPSYDTHPIYKIIKKIYKKQKGLN